MNGDKHFKTKRTPVLVRQDDGQFIEATLNEQVEYRYYKPKRLNTRITMIDYDKVMEKVCKSSQDIKIFNEIKSLADKENMIIFSAQEVAENIGCGRDAVNKVVTRAITAFFYRRGKVKGVLHINPYIYVSAGLNRSNESIVNAQELWDLKL